MNGFWLRKKRDVDEGHSSFLLALFHSSSACLLRLFETSFRMGRERELDTSSFPAGSEGRKDEIPQFLLSAYVIFSLFFFSSSPSLSSAFLSAFQ